LSFGVFDKNCGVRVSGPQILLAYLVEKRILYKMHYGLYF